MRSAVIAMTNKYNIYTGTVYTLVCRRPTSKKKKKKCNRSAWSLFKQQFCELKQK